MECKKEHEEYKFFVYVYEGEPNTILKPKKLAEQIQNVNTTKSQQKGPTEKHQPTKCQTVEVEK